MRGLLIVLGWSGLVGALLDAAIAAFAFWLVFVAGLSEAGMSVDEHLRRHLIFFYWIKDLAYFIVPDRFVDGLFGLPALLWFPLRIVINSAFGAWMFYLAGRVARRKTALAGGEV
jgi:hypothetical protein